MDEPTYLADAFNAAREGYGHQALYTRLDSDATEHLKRFAQSQRVTLNTLVQGAWLLLLSRYSGQRCVSFGATVAGRPASLEASERILGLFINTLPVVCEVAPEQCVGDWLRALQDYNLEMREQEYTRSATSSAGPGAVVNRCSTASSCSRTIRLTGRCVTGATIRCASARCAAQA